MPGLVINPITARSQDFQVKLLHRQFVLSDSISEARQGLELVAEGRCFTLCPLVATAPTAPVTSDYLTSEPRLRVLHR